MVNLEQELQLALEGKRLLEQLLENKGWQKAVQLVQQQADQLQQEILFSPCLGLDSAMAQEYKKGQLEGRICLSNLIETELAVCESTIFNIRRKQDEHSSDGSTGSSSGGDGSSGEHVP